MAVIIALPVEFILVFHKRSYNAFLSFRLRRSSLIFLMENEKIMWGLMSTCVALKLRIHDYNLIHPFELSFRVAGALIFLAVPHYGRVYSSMKYKKLLNRTTFIQYTFCRLPRCSLCSLFQTLTRPICVGLRKQFSNGMVEVRMQNTFRMLCSFM